MLQKAEVLQRIHAYGVLPAIRVREVKQVERAISELGAAGLFLAEVAMSAQNVSRLLEAGLACAQDEMILGAGTVLDARMATECIAAGARFIVTPALDHGVLAACQKQGVPVVMGALSLSEIHEAWTGGADCVKIFPAGALGGPDYIRTMKRLLPQTRFLPMGGVSLERAGDYLDAGAFALGVGSDLINEQLLCAETPMIQQRALRYLAAVARSRQNPAQAIASRTVSR